MFTYLFTGLSEEITDEKMEKSEFSAGEMDKCGHREMKVFKTKKEGKTDSPE